MRNMHSPTPTPTASFFKFGDDSTVPEVMLNVLYLGHTTPNDLMMSNKARVETMKAALGCIANGKYRHPWKQCDTLLSKHQYCSPITSQ